MFYYTHQSTINAPHYVYTDVLSDVPLACMIYYTHHCGMDVPQNVNIDVISDIILA